MNFIKINIMGNLEGKRNKRYSVLQDNFLWKKQTSLGYCELVKDSKSGIIGERYVAYVEQLSKQVQIYQFRKDHSTYIVGVYSLQEVDSEYLCVSQSTIRVITERIPYRLVDLGHIGFNEGLYIIESCMKGVQQIFEKYQPFEFDENMICFNEHGQAKIWFNQNISVNIPQTNPKQTSTQKKLITQLIQAVEDRMGGIKLAQFKQTKKSYDLSKFRNVYKFINDVRGTADKLNNIILPSMVLENLLSKKDSSPQKTQNSIEDRKRTLPKGLPPLPPKSRSRSRERKQSRQKIPFKTAPIIKQEIKSPQLVKKPSNQLPENTPDLVNKKLSFEVSPKPSQKIVFRYQEQVPKLALKKEISSETVDQRKYVQERKPLKNEERTQRADKLNITSYKSQQNLPASYRPNQPSTKVKFTFN